MQLETIRAANAAKDICHVGQLHLFKSENFARIGMIDRPKMSPNEAAEKIKALDPATLVSLGFEVAESWPQDSVDGFGLVRGNEKDEIYPDDYMFYMVPADQELPGIDDIVSGAPLITEDVLDNVESEKLPLVYNTHNNCNMFTTVWRFKAVRQGVDKEYKCAVSLWSLVG